MVMEAAPASLEIPVNLIESHARSVPVIDVETGKEVGSAKTHASFRQLLDALVPADPRYDHVDVEIKLIRHGNFRAIRDDGKAAIRHMFERAAGTDDITQGFIRSYDLVLIELAEPDAQGYLYECLDGNHRLAVLRELYAHCKVFC
jgi:hypothetical protein